jgi:DNA helicase II / ATP-dependent DNA helicase PcrA
MISLENLNPAQQEAVKHTEGPLLILAGAGTGKTRVITYRIAWLIEHGIPPSSILAVTFTNKAAGEMRERVAAMLRESGRAGGDVWVSTFHSFCARLLRREAPSAGLPHDFAIYDDDDQISAVKQALRDEGIDDKTLPPRSLRERISHAKNSSISAEQLAGEAYDDWHKKVARVYAAYERILERNGAVDFDDLLLRAVKLLRENADVREKWRRRFQYLHVDEFQDTNRAQADLVRLLANEQNNVCVVGDEDQSIYSWRGALAGNLLRFSGTFPNTKIIRLEENYRSTQTILDAAAAVVERNSQRLGKALRATVPGGDSLSFYEGRDAIAEAEYTVGEIVRLTRDDPATRIAVLYRTAAQSRLYEEGLRRYGIKYRVVGGYSFYRRAEVRDALCYVRVVLHPEDDIALARILNVPPRGIGATTLQNLRASAAAANTSLWEAMGNLPPTARSASLASFRKLMEELRRDAAPLEPAQMMREILERSGYGDWIKELDHLEHTSKGENLAELVNAVADATEHGESLQDILDAAALVSDADDFDGEVTVSLMTLHAAKGLEFDHVLLAGMEEGLFPHNRALDTKEGIEEERRLCYVGMTRARRTLTLTRATYRRIYGNESLGVSQPSRFLEEIPAELIRTAPGSGAEASSGRGRAEDDEYSQAYPHKRPARTASRGARSGGGGGRKSSLVGTRVKHPTYGVGTILDVEGEGEDRRLTVSFTDYGRKKLVERYAKLDFA